MLYLHLPISGRTWLIGMNRTVIPVCLGLFTHSTYSHLSRIPTEHKPKLLQCLLQTAEDLWTFSRVAYLSIINQQLPQLLQRDIFVLHNVSANVLAEMLRHLFEGPSSGNSVRHPVAPPPYKGCLTEFTSANFNEII